MRKLEEIEEDIQRLSGSNLPSSGSGTRNLTRTRGMNSSRQTSRRESSTRLVKLHDVLAGKVRTQSFETLRFAGVLVSLPRITARNTAARRPVFCPNEG